MRDEGAERGQMRVREKDDERPSGELWIVAREVTNNLQKDETLLLLDSKTGLKVTFK